MIRFKKLIMGQQVLGATVLVASVLILAGCGANSPSNSPISSFNFKNGEVRYYDVVNTQNVKVERYVLTTTTGVATAGVTNAIKISQKTFSPTASSTTTPSDTGDIYYVQRADGLFRIINGTIPTRANIMLPLATANVTWADSEGSYTLLGYENATTNIGTSIYSAKIAIDNEDDGTIDYYGFSSVDIVNVKLVPTTANVDEYRKSVILTNPF